jgi:hypothetical protein
MSVESTSKRESFGFLRDMFGHIPEAVISKTWEACDSMEAAIAVLLDYKPPEPQATIPQSKRTMICVH